MFGKVRKQIGGTCLRSQKLSRALVERNKATSLRRNESEYSPRTCSIGRPAGGTLCPPPLISQLAKMSFENMFDLTAGVYFKFYNIRPRLR